MSLAARHPFHTFEVSDPEFELEGLRQITVRSYFLRRRADITVFVPKAAEGTVSSLLLLLHGAYGSHWVWTQKAGVHRTAQGLIDAGEIKPLVIAMPSDGLGRDGSAYLPHANEDAERWIVDEVVRATLDTVPCLVPQPKIFIAGLSMGGFGALRLGAKYSRRFAGVSAHSAITDIAQMGRFVTEPVEEYMQCAPQLELDILYWMRRNGTSLPRLRFDCGTEDDLLAGNRRLHEALRDAHQAHVYEELAGGHDWEYWRRHVEKTLRFVNE